jgi:integrase
MRDASIECPSLRDRRISPHTIRRATALHLLQSGVDIYVIALWLGHGSIETTHIYLEADLKTKERALLAFLMALHWYPTRRRELELPLIRYYYEGLLAQGLENYSFDEL